MSLIRAKKEAHVTKAVSQTEVAVCRRLCPFCKECECIRFRKALSLLRSIGLEADWGFDDVGLNFSVLLPEEWTLSGRRRLTDVDVGQRSVLR